jgi:hypothetical protein
MTSVALNAYLLLTSLLRREAGSKLLTPCCRSRRQGPELGAADCLAEMAHMVSCSDPSQVERALQGLVPLTSDGNREKRSYRGFAEVTNVSEDRRGFLYLPDAQNVGEVE